MGIGLQAPDISGKDKDTLLETVDLKKVFGGLAAVDDVSLKIKNGELRAIIGPNGSGKTTLINIITGLTPTTKGSVYFEGREITKFGSHRIASLGISRTFQLGLIFNNMTVLDNVMVGRHIKSREKFVDAVLRLPHFYQEERSSQDFAMAQLERVGLASKAREMAKNVTHVQQRLIELARALATEPKMLFLDEPMGGMTTQESDDLIKLILRLRGEGITIVFIEHNMRVVMGIADRITVLNYGKKIAEGSRSEIQSNELVIEAYLGR